MQHECKSHDMHEHSVDGDFELPNSTASGCTGRSTGKMWCWSGCRPPGSCQVGVSTASICGTSHTGRMYMAFAGCLKPAACTACHIDPFRPNLLHTRNCLSLFHGFKPPVPCAVPAVMLQAALSSLAHARKRYTERRQHMLVMHTNQHTGVCRQPLPQNHEC